MIKKQLLLIMIILSSMISCNHQSSINPENWNEEELGKWFQTGEWKSGWEIAPDKSINKKEFACQYSRNKDRWNKAFLFLKTNDLNNLKPGRYELEGDSLYVNVDEYITKEEENTRYEAHRKYADIQYLVYGEENIGITTLKSTMEATSYDSVKDIIFLIANQNSYQLASPEQFFVFFPGDAHRPCVKIGENMKVRKVVVKVLIE